MVVLGAGAIGVEFASFYRALGVEVTIVEYLPRVPSNTLLIFVEPEAPPKTGALAKALTEAEAVGLLTVAGNRLRFRHPLVRSAVYRSASRVERQSQGRWSASAPRARRWL